MSQPVQWPPPEYGDITAPFLDGLSASDVRAAFMSMAYLQDGMVEIDAPLDLAVQWIRPIESRPSQASGWSVIGENTFRVPTMRPLLGELYLAGAIGHAARAGDPDAPSPAVAMVYRIMEWIQTSPIVLGEFEDLYAVVHPIAAHAAQAFTAEPGIANMLGMIASELSIDGLAFETAAKVTRGLRWAWLMIAFAEPALLRPRPELQIVRATS